MSTTLPPPPFGFFLEYPISFYVSAVVDTIFHYFLEFHLTLIDRKFILARGCLMDKIRYP